MVRVLDTDFLVIGSGLAGSSAAIEANKRGLNVIIIEKALLGKGGSSRVGRRFITPPVIYEQLFNIPQPKVDIFQALVGTRYFYDQELSKRILDASGIDAWRLLVELEGLGVFWRRTSDGTFWPEPHVGTHSPKADLAGKLQLDTLGPEIRRRNITVLEEHMATRLLTHNGEVIGATALDIINGELVAIRAKATVLATGTSSTYSVSTPPITLTGDGYTLALKAGAELLDMCELVWYDYWAPEVNLLGMKNMWHFSIAAFSLRPFAPEIKHEGAGEFLDENGVSVFEKYPKLFAGYKKLGVDLHQATGAIAHASAIEMAEGREPLKISYKHIPNIKARMKELWAKYDFLEKLGIDPEKDDIMVGCWPHTSMGGIRITSRAEAYGVPGLYAVGGVSALGTGMNLCLASGKWAAEAGAERAKSTEMPALDWSQIQEEEDKINSILTKKVADGVFPASVIKRIKELMWEKCGFWKNEKDMTECLNELERIREEVIPKMCLESDTRAYNKGLVEYLEVENLLEVSQVITETALRRKGSSGQYIRTDYPKPGDLPFTTLAVKLVEGKHQYHKIEAPPELKERLALLAGAEAILPESLRA